MATSQVIPIEHHPTSCEIATESGPEIPAISLLELIQAVDEVSDSKAEVLATVQFMMESGRIKLAPAALDAPDLVTEQTIDFRHAVSMD